MTSPGQPGASGRLALRRNRHSDHDTVWALHNAVLAGTGAHLSSGPWDDDLHHIEAVYLDGGGEFLVGVIDDEVVAMGALQQKRRRCRRPPGYARPPGLPTARLWPPGPTGP